MAKKALKKAYKKEIALELKKKKKHKREKKHHEDEEGVQQ